MEYVTPQLAQTPISVPGFNRWKVYKIRLFGRSPHNRIL